MTTLNGWTITRPISRVSKMGPAFMVTAPTCPAGPHPQRWCDCAPFRTYAEAVAYITEQLQEVTC